MPTTLCFGRLRVPSIGTPVGGGEAGMALGDWEGIDEIGETGLAVGLEARVETRLEAGLETGTEVGLEEAK